MKKLLLSFYFAFCILHYSSAQNPLVKQWDYRFGGTANDGFKIVKQTIDGGYILGGLSSSGLSGDKTEISRGASDYWIVKIDSLGNKQWDKDFGGTKREILYSLEQTSDGGYILGGWSESGISGDKTQPIWDTCTTCFHYGDYWIVKTDSLGNKQWDKDFGGLKYDVLYSTEQTADGGYIVGGLSGSEISGDKTQPSWGQFDYWIIKTDSLGNKQWDKDFGGLYNDQLYSLHQTMDRGYILGGVSFSDSSGDKTQATRGFSDYWIIKIDSLGNKQWDKDFGGTSYDYLYCIQQTTEGGYILGGISESDSSGDKSQNQWGLVDYWIVKTDSLGNKQWDKDFGGTDEEDEFDNISQTSDGGYLVIGTSYSPISGDKTENNLGIEQAWIVRTDSLGNKQWDKTLLTLGHDEASFAIQTEGGCFVVAVNTDGGIGGYKTQPNWDTIAPFSNDYWIIKFCDTTLTTSINPISNFQFPISISPNPFNESLVISSEPGEKSKSDIIVKDIEGRVLFRTPNSKLPAKLDLSFLSKGIYLLETIVDGERTVNKIVKQ